MNEAVRKKTNKLFDHYQILYENPEEPDQIKVDLDWLIGQLLASLDREEKAIKERDHYWFRIEAAIKELRG